MTSLFESIKVFKWPHKEKPTEVSVSEEMKKYGFTAYDLQTIPPWFERSRHAHDYEEIRAAVAGVTTFHFDLGPITIEAGTFSLFRQVFHMRFKHTMTSRSRHSRVLNRASAK